MQEINTDGINVERVRLFVAGLRSGRFRKGTGFLHRLVGAEPGPGDMHCCLGVGSIVAKENGCPVTSRFIGEVGFREERFGDQESQFLSAEVMRWYGFDTNNPLLLTADGRIVFATHWNDRGPFGEVMAAAPEPDFGPIADAFERTYLSGDTPPAGNAPA